MTDDIMDNGLYRLKPKDGEEQRTWCRHNLLIASKTKNGEWVFKDTYWSSSSEATTYKHEEVKDQIEYIFNLNHSKDVTDAEYEQYSPKDRTFIPMGSWHARHIIDTRAEKSRTIIIELIKRKIRDSESSIKMELNNIERLTKILKDVNNNGDIENIYI